MFGSLFEIFVKAPGSQTFMHFKRPVQSLLLTIRACLCHRGKKKPWHEVGVPASAGWPVLPVMSTGRWSFPYPNDTCLEVLHGYIPHSEGFFLQVPVQFYHKSRELYSVPILVQDVH